MTQQLQKSIDSGRIELYDFNLWRLIRELEKLRRGLKITRGNGLKIYENLCEEKSCKTSVRGKAGFDKSGVADNGNLLQGTRQRDFQPLVFS